MYDLLKELFFFFSEAETERVKFLNNFFQRWLCLWMWRSIESDLLLLFCAWILRLVICIWIEDCRLCLNVELVELEAFCYCLDVFSSIGLYTWGGWTATCPARRRRWWFRVFWSELGCNLPQGLSSSVQVICFLVLEHLLFGRKILSNGARTRTI